MAVAAAQQRLAHSAHWGHVLSPDRGTAALQSVADGLVASHIDARGGLRAVGRQGAFWRIADLDRALGCAWSLRYLLALSPLCLA